MLDHASIPVADVGRAAEFYDAVLAAIGLRRLKERPGAVGYGPGSRAAPVFWVLKRQDQGSASPGVGLHMSFHATALRRDAGAPGLRPQYAMPFYAAFVIDLDNFKIEAVCRAPR
jgi:hypothetical protein